MNSVRSAAGVRQATVVACETVVCDYFRLEIARVDADEGVRLKGRPEVDGQVARAVKIVTEVQLGVAVVDGPGRAWAERFVLDYRQAIDHIRQALLSDGSLEGVLAHAIVASAEPEGPRGVA